MTQKDKELLLKDLCARLPYRVKFNHEDKHTLCKILYIIPIYDYFNVIYYDNAINEPKKTNIDNVKPYLFPLSSMTESQNDSWRDAFMNDLAMSASINYPESEKYLALSHAKSLEWLYKNHFDVNGLIEKGFAIDATGLNIY